MSAAGGVTAIEVDAGRGGNYRLAWTAYLWPSLKLILWCGFSWLLTMLSWQMGAVAFALGLVRFAYVVFFLASIELYTDVAGIWVFRGVFPWNRGSYGVRWADAEDAVYFPGLFAWLAKSYRVRVPNRFNPRAEVDLGHVRNGDEAVIHINQRAPLERSLDRAVAQFNEAAARGR